MRHVVVLMMLGATGCTQVVLDNLRDVASVDAELEVLGLDAVTIDAPEGDLVVVGDGAEGMVVLDLVLRSDRPIYDGFDTPALDSIEVTVRSQAVTGAFVTFAVGDDFPEYVLEGTIHVPPGMAVSVTDGSGDLDVSDVGNLDVVDDDGDLSVRNITGDVTIDDGSGDITVMGVSGSVRIDDGSGDITLSDVGSYEIRSDTSGDVTGP